MTLRRFGLPAFVADRGTATTLGTGVQLDFAAFPEATYGAAGKKIIPAGTLIEPSSAAGAPALLMVPAAGTLGKKAYLLKESVEEEMAVYTGAGAWEGGLFYENLLPQATGTPRVLTDAQKTQLGNNFRFIQHEDKR